MESNKKNPNIIFLMADDMGYGDVSFLNEHSKIPTPNMDKLAAKGCVFKDAHSSSAVCTPSRYSILTGRYCWRTELKEGVIGGYSKPLIENERSTVAKILKEKGYNTGCIGKWHIGLNFFDKAGELTSIENEIDFSKKVKGGPIDLGFDYAYYNAGCGTAAPPYGFIENDSFVDENFHYFESEKSSDFQNNGMMGDSWQSEDADLIITDKACEFIKKQNESDAPFFLYLTPNAPHEPCAPEFVPNFAKNKTEAGSRGDLVWLFDWIVGKIVNVLEKTNELENTMIIITSDNGALPGDFTLNKKGERKLQETKRKNFVFEDYGHKSCGFLRGYKAHIWEGGHRIPLLISWPDHIKESKVVESPVCLSDFYATCAEIVGSVFSEEKVEDSISFLPYLFPQKNEKIKLREEIIHHSSFGVFSIRSKEWKMILETKTSGGWPTPRGEKAVPGNDGQLYNMKNDPEEINDLWEQRQDIVESLEERFKDYLKFETSFL